MASLDSTSGSAQRGSHAHEPSQARAHESPHEAHGERRARLTQHATDPRALASAHAIVDIVAGLTDDADILTASMLFALLDTNAPSAEQAEVLAGPAAARIGTELLRLGSLNIAAPAGGAVSLSGNQSESLREMLLAIVTDPR